MSGPLDDTTEYLIEEYALGRLHGDGAQRVEGLLRADPALRARVEDLRREAALLSHALSTAGADAAAPVEDAQLAMLLDGALDELERASLEASLAGDTTAQARLAELYRETQAVVNDAPMPEPAERQEAAGDVLPFARASSKPSWAYEAAALAVSAALVVVSLLVPAVFGTPALFLALAAFGAWAAKNAARSLPPNVRARRRVLGIVTALSAFVAAPFTGPYALWCYVCSAAWYWYWLVQRWGPVQAVSERGQGKSVESRSSQAAGGRG